MKHLQFICLLLIVFSCKESPQIEKEAWLSKPLSQWPDFALTNTISFSDTTYTDIANSFLINTGSDTLAVSCKHLFLVFRNQLGFQSVHLGNDFKYWNMYPKNQKEKSIAVQSLINGNTNEQIGDYNTLKVRDWLIFEVDQEIKNLYPLKIRHTAVKANEIVYAVGWGAKQKENATPAVIKLQCFKNLGDYYFTKTLSKGSQPYGRSGSPVIDKNGYLVGIVSGQEGNMCVIGSVRYLRNLFDQYDVPYTDPFNK